MQHVLLTGATSGIGKATATLFAERQIQSLILTGRRKDRLFAIKNEVEKTYSCRVLPLCFDIRSPDECEAAYNSIPESFRPIDLLINNAGLAKGLSSIHEGKISDWETMLDTNVKGLLYLTRLVSREMVNRKKGHIINVASTAGKEVYPKGNVYCASKHAVDALTRAIRLDLYTYGIRVGQVAPGHVEETEFANVRFDGDKEKAKIYEDFNPLRAKNVAEAIYFMASQPPHVTIQDIVLMGTQQANSTNIDRSGRLYDES